MRQKILMTGASGGIGKSVVKKFLEQDDVVINLDVNPIQDNEILTHQQYQYIPTDVTDPNQLMKAKKRIEETYGLIDHIIGMAGINMKSEIGGIETVTIEDIDRSIKLNLNSHIYVTKIFLELLKNSKETNKTITMISSINAICDYGLPAYSAAKSGIYGFMKSMTRPMGKLGIRVNTISLGTVPHDKDVIDGNEYFESKIQELPMGQFLKPIYVADAIYALLYEMKGMNGQNMILDMGQSV